MSCLDTVKDRLTEQRDAWTRELNQVVSASFSGALNNLTNEIMNLGSNIASSLVDQAWSSVEDLVRDHVSNIANQLVSIFTFSDSIQIALFRRLSLTLQDYVAKRRVIVDDIRETVNGMLNLLNRISQQSLAQIVRDVESSSKDLESAILLLKAIERGLSSSPPFANNGYLGSAHNKIRSAKDVLLDDSLELPDIMVRPSEYFDLLENSINEYVDDKIKYYGYIFAGLAKGLERLAKKTSSEIPGYYLVGLLSGLNFTGNKNNSLGGVDPKIKSTAQLVVAFPFHMSTLNHLINASYNRVKGLRESAEDIKSEMDTALNSISIVNGDYSELYGYRIGWVSKLNPLVQISSPTEGIFGSMDTTTNYLISNLNAINEIINYLGTPNYIKNINQASEKMRKTIAIMIPSLLAAITNVESYNRAKAYLGDILVSCNVLDRQDSELLSKLSLINTPETDNQYVDDAMNILNELEEKLGSFLSEKWGISNGSAVAQVASILSPGIISSVSSPLFNVQDNVLNSVLGDSGLGFTDMLSGEFGGIGASLASLANCADNEGVELPDGPDILPAPEAALVDSSQSIGNARVSLTARLRNNNITKLVFTDMSINETLIEDPDK